MSPRKKRGSGAAGGASRADARLNAVRRELAAVVGANADAIVQAAIAKAIGGHFQSMKFLFAIAGIHPGPVHPGPSKDEPAGDLSLAQLLCKELGLPEEGSAAAEEEAAQAKAASTAGECTVE